MQGPLVNHTYRWVTQHAASCPLAGVVGCVLPTCVQGLAERNSRSLGEGEKNWFLFGDSVFLLLILVSFLLVSTWIHVRRGHRYSCRRPSRPAVHLSSRGRARWVGGRRWQLSRRRRSLKKATFYFPLISFWCRKLHSFFRYGFFYFYTAEYAGS